MNFIKKIITPNQKVFIKKIQHVLYRSIHKLSKIDTCLSYSVIKQQSYDIFFGYYDITPFNSNDEILYLKRKKNSDEIEICLNDSNNLTKEKIIAVSRAWNWQQGCRLRWFPGYDDKIIFNIFESNNYGACIIDKKGQRIQDFKHPFYDISHDGSLGLTLNFERLGVLRPGYGYTCRSYFPNEKSNESIKVIDLSKDVVVDDITYNDIAKIVSYSGSFKNCYINHLSFSPNDKYFLFFWIEIKEGYHQASLLVYDLTSKKIIPLELHDKVSHYVWLDDDNILCTVYENSLICRYFVYNVVDKTKRAYCSNCLAEDGHPSVDNASFILTDTYPDRNGFQFLYLVDSIKDTKKEIFRVYMKPVANGEMRTDLHPRFNLCHSKICFDTNINGNREIIIVNRK